MTGTFFRMMRSGVVNGVWIMAFLACPPLARAEEPDDARILERILGTRDTLLKATALTNSDTWPVFIAVWDFDGTILKGDCSEGLKVEGRTVYPGLAEVAI